MQTQSGKFILLVEDMAIIAMAEANTLKKNGFRVITAYNGKEAIKLATENPDLNLILMDIDLGKGMDGTEAAQTILKTHDIPIVFLSNHTEKEIVDKTEKITSYGYVVKNSGETVLLASIKMAFKLFEAHKLRFESERKLLESDKKFHILEKQIDDVIWTMDMNFRFTYISPSVEKMHGYTVDEMMKLNLQDYVTEESAQKAIDVLGEEISAYLKDKIEKNIVTIEIVQRKKDGTVFPTEIRARFLLDEHGLPSGIIGVSRDISQRYLAEKALRDSEKTLNLALEGAQIGFWDSNYETGRVYRSDIWASMLGYTIDEVDNTPEFWQKHIHPDDYERVMTEVNKHESGKVDSFGVEHRMRTKSGKYKWILDWGKVFERTESGKPIRAMGLHIDIDDRIKTQQQLFETNRTLTLAIEGAQIGLWSQNFETGEVIRSEYWASMLGYKINEIENKLDFWKSLIHPDDYEMTIKAAEEHEQGKTEFYKVQHRLKCKDGSYKWILNWGKISERDNAGLPLKANGIHLDIDDRVKSEEHLIDSEERYRRFFEEDLSGVFLSTPESGIKICNRAYVNMMEYDSIESLLQANPVSHYPQSQQRIDFLNLLRKERKLTNYEGELVTRTGKLIKTLENILGVFDEKDNLIEFWGYVNDITDRKNTEQILKNAAIEKEALHRELLHRVKNSFNLIKSLMYLEREKLDNKEANKILENLEMRIGTLSKMYSLLNISGVSQKIDLGEYLNQITSSLAESYLQDAMQIEIKSSFDNIETSPKTASSVGLIVNEILTNSLKYAFPDSKHGSIYVSLKKINEDAEIEITDNGVGVSDNFNINDAKGMGLQLINMLTQQLSGTLTVEANNGTMFKIVFPLEQ